LARQRLQLLGRWVNTVGMAAGTLWQPPPSAGGADAEIGVDEVAEIAFYEVVGPVDGLGAAEDLMQFWPVRDGSSVQEYLNFSGRDDSNVWPLVTNVTSDGITRTRYYLGHGLVDALLAGQRGSIPALLNTTLKYRRNHTIIAQAGATAVTGPFSISAYGYKYNQRMLDRLPATTMNMSFTIEDRLRNRTFRIEGPIIPLLTDRWDEIVGGQLQSDWHVMPFHRFARNTNVTVANTRYELRFDLGNVQNQFQDLFFDYEVFPNILIVKHFGARVGANMARTWIHIFGADDPIGPEQPPGRIPTSEFNNPIHFGRIEPLAPAGQGRYLALQQEWLRDTMIAEDRAVVAIQDNGTPIAADSVTVALAGIKIERPSS
jgi:hypothetical protein